jgi:hypothetical protein
MVWEMGLVLEVLGLFTYIRLNWAGSSNKEMPYAVFVYSCKAMLI